MTSIHPPGRAIDRVVAWRLIAGLVLYGVLVLSGKLPLAAHAPEPAGKPGAAAGKPGAAAGRPGAAAGRPGAAAGRPTAAAPAEAGASESEHTELSARASAEAGAQHSSDEQSIAPAAANAEAARPEVARPVAHLWAVAPFVALLAAIAVLPLAGGLAHWWEHHRNKLLVSVVLAGATLAYLGMAHPDASWSRAGATLRHTLLGDYVPFMVLLFSLFTISGGIAIAGDLPAHALTNTLFLAVGGCLASLFGTTGAAMLLIRPLLETNRERKFVRHTVVFFILIVCNCGGLLLPLGDPPLFLGYLNGVPFLWTLSLWRSWLVVNGSLLALYFAWDHFYFYAREAPRDIARDETRVHRMRLAGLTPNGWLLLGIVLSVALLDPGKPVPGTAWHPWPYLREAVQLGLVAVSLLATPPTLRAHHGFNYGPILEVACLFLGIFVCMQPALEILSVRGAELGLKSAASFYWTSGALSSVLDNAPTYLVFFKAAEALTGQTAAETSVAGVAVPLLEAISLGAVLMGAMTYIGNGPNFMVKTIAESAGVKMPSFFGYLLYSVGILLPILMLNAWLFL